MSKLYKNLYEGVISFDDLTFEQFEELIKDERLTNAELQVFLAKGAERAVSGHSKPKTSFEQIEKRIKDLKLRFEKCEKPSDCEKYADLIMELQWVLYGK